MRINGFLRGNNGSPTDGYLRGEKYPNSFDGFLRGNNGSPTDGYLRRGRWAFDTAASAPSVDVTGTGSGSITALTGATVGAHGTKGDAEGSITALTGAATGAQGIDGTASGSITAITGAASGEHNTPAQPPEIINQGGYSGEIRARRRIEEPEDVRRAKARRAILARLYPVHGAARGQLAVVYGVANGWLGARGLGAGAIGRTNGAAKAEFSQFSASEIEEIMAIIEGIEALEALPEAA